MSSMRSLILFTCAVVVVWPGRSQAQSNYASQANSIEYQGEGLPEEATLDGKVTKLDDLSPIIFLNRTKAALNCAAGFMQVELKFNEPFYGKAYADYDRNSACQTSGKGDLSYRIDLPLKGCGTKQGPQRVFTNNIVVRFHPGLEMDGDEIITIVCRYPPPVAPIPAGLPAPIINEPAIVEPPLKGIQILFIICAIMFLTLLLLGLGVSYYCLRRRPIPIVRRVVHVGSGSEITALESGSIDDLFLTTVTERTTIEDVERHKRLVTEYKARPVPAPAPPPPPPVDPTWDVTIRNYEAQRQRQWEDFSDVSSASGAPSVASASMPVPSSTYLPSAYAADELRSPELVGNMKPVELPPEDRSVSNWDVLIRVLQEVDMPDTSISTAALHTDLHRYPLQRQLSYDDKLKWKEIITTESTLRTMLSEATVREDFERIRSDARYENLFEPRSWDVIIRILAPPEDVELRQSKRSKKRETWDTRSRRSSLPTLYEYDSDGDSSVRTITQEPQLVAATHLGYAGHAGSLASGSRSRRTSRSSYNSNNIDMRSMSEVIVNFGRMSGGPSGRSGSGGEPSEEGSSYIVSHSKAYFDDDDDDEEARYDQRSLQRSLSHPSLARSASEFTERWIIPEDHMDLRADSEANHSSMYGSGTMDVDTRTTYIKQSRTTVSRERRDNW